MRRVVEPENYNLDYARAILIGLQHKHPIFSGVFVDKDKKREQRRAANRARKHNRPSH